VAGGDLHVAKIDASVKHGGHERVAKHLDTAAVTSRWTVRRAVMIFAAGRAPGHEPAAKIITA